MKANLGRKGGLVGLILVVLVIVGLVGVYFGNQWFSQRNYIRLFDGDAVRQLDMPPYAERLTDADLELIGVCDINIGTSKEQANNFIKSMCNRYGYMWTVGENDLQIEIRRHYLITGSFDNNCLKLRWTPVLPENLKARAAALENKSQ